MTIGDEKVRRWSLQYMDALEGEFMCADPAGPYVLHSAYAELAAERDALAAALLEAGDLAASSMTGPAQSESLRAIEEISVIASEHRDGRLSALERAVAAESRLAELRGRVNALADEWESVLKQMGGKGTPLTDNVIAICARELRAALAAAEGE